MARGVLDLLEQRIDLVFIEHDRQQAVVEAVVVEDVGKTRRDHHPYAVIGQGPRRMLTTGAAAKVVPRQQHLGTLVALVIQHEVRIHRPLAVVLPRLAMVEIAPAIEQIGTEAGTFHRLQELLGDDRVGIDVGAVQRYHQTVQMRERFHQAAPLLSMGGSVRTSTK